MSKVAKVTRVTKEEEEKKLMLKILGTNGQRSRFLSVPVPYRLFPADDKNNTPRITPALSVILDSGHHVAEVP